MSIATKTAIYRFGRVVVGAALAAGVAAGINYFNSGALDGTQLTGFVAIGTAGFTALDKFFREKGVYGGKA